MLLHAGLSIMRSCLDCRCLSTPLGVMSHADVSSVRSCLGCWCPLTLHRLRNAHFKNEPWEASVAHSTIVLFWFPFYQLVSPLFSCGSFSWFFLIFSLIPFTLFAFRLHQFSHLHIPYFPLFTLFYSFLLFNISPISGLLFRVILQPFFLVGFSCSCLLHVERVLESGCGIQAVRLTGVLFV